MGIDLTRFEEQLQRRRREAKKLALEQSLASGKTLVRIDTRIPGVRVPAQFQGEYALGLNLSWHFAQADMRWNDRGIAVTLSFSGTRFRCQLPWTSIWGYVPAQTQETKAWTDDVPRELGGTRDPSTVPPAEPVEAEPVPEDPASNVKRPQIRAWADWAVELSSRPRRVADVPAATSRPEVEPAPREAPPDPQERRHAFKRGPASIPEPIPPDMSALFASDQTLYSISRTDRLSGSDPLLPVPRLESRLKSKKKEESASPVESKRVGKSRSSVSPDSVKRSKRKVPSASSDETRMDESSEVVDEYARLLADVLMDGGESIPPDLSEKERESTSRDLSKKRIGSTSRSLSKKRVESTSRSLSKKSDESISRDVSKRMDESISEDVSTQTTMSESSGQSAPSDSSRPRPWLRLVLPDESPDRD